MWLTKLSDKSFSANIERTEINFVHAVNSPMPILMKIKSDSKLTNELMVNAYEQFKDYIDIYFPGTESAKVSTEILNLIFAQYYTWNPVDIQAFINFIKLNKPDTSGHKISPVELVESIKEYELQKAVEQEKIIQNKKFLENNFTGNVPDFVKEFISKREEKEKADKQAISEKARQAAIRQIEKNEKWNELSVKHFPSYGEGMTDEQKDIAGQKLITEWQEYLNTPTK